MTLLRAAGSAPSAGFRARIHRGATQVGGTCIELESRGSRLLLDLGMPLDAEEEDRCLPDVPGLSSGDPSLLGVVVSHLHADHCGLVPYASPGLRVAIGGKAARILEEAAFFTGRDLGIRPAWQLRDREAFEIGPFRITPYLVDHSAFDAYALFVEAGGRRLFYSGDFRAHGNDPSVFERLLCEPPAAVDALLMEGTLLGEGREQGGPDEADLRRALARRFLEWPGLVLVAWSAQNLDRLVTLHAAARDAGRTLAVDLYAATLARAAASESVPSPGAPGLVVICRQRERVLVLEAREFDRTRSVAAWRIYPEDIRPRAHELVLVLRPSMLRELDRLGALNGALAIWSMWRGYLDGEAEQRMQALFRERGVPLEVHHVSGHAYVPDLRRLAEALQAGRVVPIHTSAPERFEGLFMRVVRMPDGAWWEV